MTLKRYLKENNTNISDISRNAGIPYTTVREVINGVTDIEQCHFGLVMKIADSMNLSIDDFYSLYRQTYVLPDVEGYDIVVRNKSYYLRPDNDKKRLIRLCKVNEENRQYLKEIIQLELFKIEGERKVEEMRGWIGKNII